MANIFPLIIFFYSFCTINATQIPVNSTNSPLLPPNCFLHSKSSRLRNASYTTSLESFKYFKKQQQCPSNHRKKRKYVDGAIYTHIFDDRSFIIKPGVSSRILLNCNLENGERSTVEIYRDNPNSIFLDKCNELGEALSKKRQRVRWQCNDLGKMKIVGKHNDHEFSVGKYVDVKECSKKIALLASDYFDSIGFKKYVDAIASCNKYGKCDGMENLFCSCIVQSQNLVNSAHFDVNDNSISISTWTETNPGMAKGWYFVLPNVTFDGKNGIAIQLSHGTTIKWDGREIWHCTAMEEGGENNNVFGTFFASKK